MTDAADRTRKSVRVTRSSSPDEIASAINKLSEGGGSSWRKVALAANATSTTVPCFGVSADRAVAFVAQQPGGIAVTVSAINDGEIVLAHASNATPGNAGLMWRQ